MQKVIFEKTLFVMQNETYKNILCFGEVLWDMFPTGAKPGGALLNVAIHLKKQGQNADLISKTGDDKEGQKLKKFLNQAGLNIENIQTDEKLTTSKVLIHLDDSKNATYEICEPVAWDNIQYNENIDKKAIEAGLIIFGSLASRNKTTRNTLFEILEKSNAVRLLDVNLRPPFYKKEVIEKLLQKSDFIKLNDDELLKIASWRNIKGTGKEIIQSITKIYQCSIICVTRGANGAVLYLNNHFYEHAGFKIKEVDTVGAGDSFLASLISCLAKNISPKKALEYACATGAFVASQKGAVPDYSEKEIEKIINSANY